MLQTVICGPDFKLLAKVIMVYSLRRHFALESFIPISDQDRISPHIINTISSRRDMRISISGLLVDPVPSSPNLHHMNCMEDSKENYERYLGVRGLKYLTPRSNL